MRRRSFTSTVNRAVRAWTDLRAAVRGPVADGARVVRRKVYSKDFGVSRSILEVFGLSKKASW
jgi:hypothetical protein